MQKTTFQRRNIRNKTFTLHNHFLRLMSLKMA